MPSAAFQPQKIIMVATLPFDDVGGGQRSAQLARTYVNSGHDVTYLYAFKKYDFEKQMAVESDVDFNGMQHIFLDNVTPDQVFDQFEGETPVVIFQAPVDRFLPWLEGANKRKFKTVFELIDAWDTSLGGDWFKEDIFQRFINESTMVVGTARALVQILKDRGREDAVYLPNAANDAIFDHYIKHLKPIDYEEGKVSLLYYGSLYGEWFAWDHIAAAASANPDANIYLIGDKPNGISVAENVKFLGGKKITELPPYLQHCDAALLPFVPGKISDAVSPIKIFEYLSLGKPVIATRLPEIVGYPNTWIADSAEDFAKLCSEAPNLETAPIDDFISENTWGARAAEIAGSVEDKCLTAVILIHNNESIIDRCLNTLKRHGDKFLHEIIVVDNASTDNGPNIVRHSHPDVTLIINPLNGCSTGRNLGIKKATSEFICFFDSDQWFTSEFALSEPISVLRSNPSIAAIGWAAGWIDANRDHMGGPIADYLPERGTLSSEYMRKGFRTDVHYLGSGGLFLMTEHAKATLFDERFDPTCFEDTDFTYSIKSKYGMLAYRNISGIRHQPHQTTGASSGAEFYQTLFKRNSDLFKGKWSSQLIHDFYRTALLTNSNGTLVSRLADASYAEQLAFHEHLMQGLKIAV